MGKKENIRLQEVLKRLLSERGMTYKELAQKCNLAESTLKDWGNKTTGPRDLIKARTVARELGVSLEYLLFGEDDSPELDLEKIITEKIFSEFVKVTLELPKGSKLKKFLKE